MYVSICGKCSSELSLPWNEKKLCTQCRINVVPIDLPSNLTGGEATQNGFLDFYVYGWIFTQLDYAPYIGKGVGSRVTDTHVNPTTKKPSFAEQVRQHYEERGEWSYVILRSGMTEQHAYDLEQRLINEAVAAGHQLLNRIPGGGKAVELPPRPACDVPEREVMPTLLRALPQQRSIVDISTLRVEGAPFGESTYVTELCRSNLLLLQGSYVTVCDVKTMRTLYGVKPARRQAVSEWL